MLLILSGPAGAGKTTVSRFLAQHEPRAVRLSVDAIYGFISSGFIDPWLREADAQNRAGTRASAAAALAFSQAGYFVIVDGVVLPPMLALYREAAEAAGEPLHYAVLLPAADDVIARGRPRAEKPASLTEDVGRDLHRHFVAAAIAARHVIHSSGMTAEGTADEVTRRLAAGDLRV